MSQALDRGVMNQLFFEARSHNGWQDRPVTDEQIAQLYAAARMGPTAYNCSPARFVFARTEAGKARIQPCLISGNVGKAMSAPLLVVMASDEGFLDLAPRLFPAFDVIAAYRDQPDRVRTMGLRNANLQAAYLMIAARAMGLDCGPMSGFNASKLDAELFAGTSWKSNFLCAIGYGDESKLRPRGPRLDLEEACSWL